MDTKKDEIVAVTDFQEQNGWGQVVTTFRICDPLEESGMRWIRDYEELSFFRVAGYIEPVGSRPTGIWGLSAFFKDVSIANVEAAEMRLKVLKRIKVYETKMYERFGPYSTYGQFLLRVIGALGVKTIVARGLNYKTGYGQDTTYKNFGEAATNIDYMINVKASSWSEYEWNHVK